MINVTKTFLPPQEEYNAILKEAWDAGWMTNRGILVHRLEEQLKEYLGVSNILATANGTLSLQIAIKALGLQGEIITTPFSYVATTSTIVWEGCTPVFVDIHPNYFTIDETKIEAAITPNTSAIVATHVFGNPCAIEEIEVIAKKHGLKVIYDAAHCFGVKYKGKSIFEYGDISICSFHSTKLFHTGEGGAIFTTDPELFSKLFYHHNFGHKGKEAFQGIGVNGKMSELQAAMGLAVLPYFQKNVKDRKRVVNYYRKRLCKLRTIKLREAIDWNYSYYPVIFSSEQILVAALESLREVKIEPRRYFFPSLDTLPYVEPSECAVSKDISTRILCLPLYEGLEEKKLDVICNILENRI